MANDFNIDFLLRAKDEMSDTLDKGAKKLGAFSAIGSALGTVAGGVISKGIDAVTGSVGGMLDKMIGGNATFEGYNTQFEVMLGDQDLAKQRMAELAEFGAKTPFELDQVVEADTIIQGFGLHTEESTAKFGYSGKEIRRIAGDVASGTGTDFKEMSLLIGKFSAGATGEAISRMMELGITNREELTKMGLEFDKSGQLLSPLPEAMEVVLGLMDKKYGGMMDKQSSTFNGMMSNLNDWVAGTLRTIGQPIFEILKDKLGGLLTFLGSPGVQNGIKSFAEGLANGIGKAVDFVGGVIKSIEPTVVQVVSFISGVWAATGDLIGFAITMLTNLFGLGGDAAYKFGSGIGDAIDKVIFFVGEVVSFVQANLPKFQAMFEKVVGAVVAFVSGVLPTISQVVNTVITVVVTIFETVLKPALEFVIKMFGKVVDWVAENAPLISKTVNTVVNAIMNIVKVVLPIVVAVFTEVFNALKPIVEGALTIVLGIIKAIMQLITGDTKGALDTIKTAFTTAFAGVTQKIDEFNRMAAAAWSDFRGKVEIEFNKAKDAITRPIQAAVDWIRGVQSTLEGVGRGIIDGLVNGINAAPGAVLNALRNIVDDAIRNIRRSLGMASPSKVFADIGQNMMAGLALGIGQGAGLPQLALNAAVPGVGGQGNTTTNVFNLNASYGYQSPASLRDDVRMLQMAYAGV